MRSLFILLSLLALLLLTTAQQAPEAPLPKHFLVEAKVIVDAKAYNAANISVAINQTHPNQSFAFELSPHNFNKAVSVALRLFAWYNGQWTLSRQTASLSTYAPTLRNHR